MAVRFGGYRGLKLPPTGGWRGRSQRAAIPLTIVRRRRRAPLPPGRIPGWRPRLAGGLTGPVMPDGARRRSERPRARAGIPSIAALSIAPDQRAEPPSGPQESSPGARRYRPAPGTPSAQSRRTFSGSRRPLRTSTTARALPLSRPALSSPSLRMNVLTAFASIFLAM